MAQISDEQVANLIKMNARDFWTIAEENADRFKVFSVANGILLNPEQFVSVCITQFIELKRGSNFGAVKVGDNKKEEKPENPKPEDKPDFTIRDPDSPMTDAQRRKIEGEMFGFKKAKGILADYFKDNKVPSIDDLNKGQASELIQELIKAKGGGD